VTWISALGVDVYGDLVERTLEAEESASGPDATQAGRPACSRSGGRRPLARALPPARLGGERPRPDDVPEAALDEVRLVHLTGITTASGAAARPSSTIWRSGPPRAARSSSSTQLATRALALCGRSSGCPSRPAPVRRLVPLRSRGRDAPVGGESAHDVQRACAPPGAKRHRARRRAGRDPRRRAGAAARLSPTCSTRSARATASRPASPTSCCARAEPRACVLRAHAIAAAALAGTGDWETFPRLHDPAAS
jgi:hypothetical protein